MKRISLAAWMAMAASVVTVSITMGCGGGGPKYVVPDSSLASIGSMEKSAVLAAQNEVNIAKEEQNKANSDAKAAKNELDIVENEEKASKLKLDSAKVSKTAADQSGDLNRKNGAVKDVHLADLQLKVAIAKVKWVEAKKKYYDLLADAAEAHGHSAATKVELEKARLASQKGIKPSEDFNVGNFENQNMERQRKWDEARAKSESKRLEVERAASAYNMLQQQWNQESGNPQQTQQPNPYAPQNQQGTPTYAPPPQQYPQQPYQQGQQYQQNPQNQPQQPPQQPPPQNNPY